MGFYDDNSEERKEPTKIRGELYTTHVSLDNRSYFFNVKENRNKDVFLQIVESKPAEQGEGERRAIVVFADAMQDFLRGLDSSLSFIDKEQKERAKIKAEKKAAREAKYAQGGEYEKPSSESKSSGKKIYRRKGESRLVASKREEKARLHVVSKRSADSSENQKEEF
ncbi:MAG: DUF3276 family protein [Treponema sp.]|nr:DUF3276 family protein [Treponema sp.]MBQ2530217.1 DUF3276 family protein [Treponema sp.]MBQ4236191.1 DUF3276 family protein [Treponema sp.]MBQ5384718.1 DUF3276 family protein [Treponema sp.]